MSKKLLFVLAACLGLHAAAFAQWSTSGTNIYNTNTGNVGIGTANPAYKLHVPAGIMWSSSSVLKNDQGGSIELGGDNYTTSAGSPFIDFHYGALSQDYNVRLWNNGDGLFSIFANRLYTSGNVGIGTTLAQNPNGYKLAVKGKIGAHAVQVENTSTTWADYVFDKSYKLRPLAEVEQHIKEKQHLPEVPSAEEVKKNGYELTQMDATLLKKIEELTLYMIEQNKQLQELKKENEELRKDLNELKK